MGRGLTPKRLEPTRPHTYLAPSPGLWYVTHTATAESHWGCDCGLHDRSATAGSCGSCGSQSGARRRSSVTFWHSAMPMMAHGVHLDLLVLINGHPLSARPLAPVAVEHAKVPEVVDGCDRFPFLTVKLTFLFTSHPTMLLLPHGLGGVLLNLLGAKQTRNCHIYNTYITSL